MSMFVRRMRASLQEGRASLRRAPIVVASLMAGGLALSGCGEIANRISPVASQAQPISVALDGPAGARDVGIYAALADGDLRRAGVRLNLVTPPDSAKAFSLLRSGKVDVAVVPEPELMLARQHGSNTFGIAAIVQRPTSAVVTVRARHTHITSLAGLKGARVGLTGLAYQRALFNTTLAHAGVSPASVKEVDVGPNGAVGALLSGRVDAVYGGDAEAQAIALRSRHKRVTVIPPSAGAVPNYDEEVLVTRLFYFAEHKSLLRLLVQAIGRGYTSVRGNPAAGVRALVAANPRLSPTLQTAMVHADLGSFFPAAGEPWGWQDQHQWNSFGRWMTSRGLLSGPKGWVSASTNQVLAGQGP